MTRSTGMTWITASLIKEFCLTSAHIDLKVFCYIQIHKKQQQKRRNQKNKKTPTGD